MNALIIPLRTYDLKKPVPALEVSECHVVKVLREEGQYEQDRVGWHEVGQSQRVHHGKQPAKRLGMQAKKACLKTAV